MAGSGSVDGGVDRVVESRQVLPLRDHAARISHVLSLREDALDWVVVCDWLNVASSVDAVVLRSVKQYASYGWCSASDEFHESREELISKFVLQHSLFRDALNNSLGRQ